MSENKHIYKNDLSGDEVEFLQNKLYSFNLVATAMDFKGYLSFAIQDPKGEILAGIHGYVWGGCCKIETLWVSESERNHKLGSQLLTLCEDEARMRGCQQVVLETYSFQAPRFYEKNGYETIAEVPDYPAIGHQNVVMRKTLK